MFKIYFHTTDNIEIYSSNLEQSEQVEVIDTGLFDEEIYSAVKPFFQNSIDLNSALIKHRNTTFFGKVLSDRYVHNGVAKGDLLIIDRGLFPADGNLVLCLIDGVYLVKRITLGKDDIFRLSDSDDENEAVKLTAENKSIIWGIIVYQIKSLL